MTTGCLVAEAPEYGPQQQRPPVIDSQTVDPSPYKLLVLPQTGSKTFTVPFRSEDAGENVVAALYLDWNPDQEEGRDPNSLITDRNLPASSFDVVTRQFSYEWSPGRAVEPCGHLLTLLLMHESSYDDPLPKLGIQWDIASVTWQLNIVRSETPGDSNVVYPCSSLSGTAQ